MRELTDTYTHPDHLPNVFDGLWISHAQKLSYLRRLADKGLIRQKYHERGWFRYYTYARLPLSHENYMLMQLLIGETGDIPF